MTRGMRSREELQYQLQAALDTFAVLPLYPPTAPPLRSKVGWW